MLRDTWLIFRRDLALSLRNPAWIMIGIMQPVLYLVLFGPLMEKLLAAGALDVFYVPVQMKKGRPGTLVTILGRPAAREILTDILFRESTTIGVRYQQMDRACLDRTVETVQTPYGPVRFKVARRDGRELNAAPEFEDCEVLAAEHGVPLKVIQAAALQARARS